MRGERWAAVKASYKKCLSELMKMKDIIVTTFTYDKEVYPHVNQMAPGKAIKEREKLPFMADEETYYTKAMDKMVESMQEIKEEYKEFCTFLIFLSDGVGEDPTAPVEEIMKMKEDGRKVVFYTIACATTEEETMKSMSDRIGGEHRRIKKPEDSQYVFTQILGA
jgi:uncharacterized protein with von Willebrand factor type A (vWA) domain